MLPRIGPCLERRVVVGGVYGECKKRGVRGVAERPNHPRNVLERRLLHAALGDRFRRLAFEVEDDEILFDAQDLPEVIVAVDPDPEAAGAQRAQRIEGLENRASTGQNGHRVI